MNSDTFLHNKICEPKASRKKIQFASVLFFVAKEELSKTFLFQIVASLCNVSIQSLVPFYYLGV